VAEQAGANQQQEKRCTAIQSQHVEEAKRPAHVQLCGIDGII